MLIAKAKLESISPMSQSQALKSEKKPKESADSLEKRAWRERINANAEGEVIIPAMAFKNCLASIAKYLGEKVPGKMGATYTKHFEAGVIVAEPLNTQIKAETVLGEELFVPSDGRRGGSKRVWKKFPIIRSWSGELVVHILDDTITEEIFERYLREAGNFIGVGRFRPQNNGFYGRFKVSSINFEKL